MARVDLEFLPAGEAVVPTVPFALKILDGTPARLFENALLDTGSHCTVLARRLLVQNGFRCDAFPEAPGGIHGLGGQTSAQIVPKARVALRANDGSYQAVNLSSVHIVPHDIVPIIGRDLLEAFSARLTIDFHERTGHLDLG
ncbi:MAG: pepsin/retropepsin-like aspartic protease family protein [Thermoplasmatota archaeon]